MIETRSLISTWICAFLLVLALGLTMRMFPVYLEQADDEKVFIVTTRCWRTLLPGDLILDEEGKLVGITEPESRQVSEAMRNLAKSKETKERVLFTSTEGIL